jgi:hypothetical protein
MGRGIQYLVHWKGYDHTEDTWEPRRNITNGEKVLQEFYHRNPEAFQLVLRDEEPQKEDNVTISDILDISDISDIDIPMDSFSLPNQFT